MNATGAIIKGNITATSGYIGGSKEEGTGWSISTNQISTGTLGGQDSFYLRSSGEFNSGVSIGGSENKKNWRLAIGKNFGVDSDG
jgi:hypothetical protein